MFSLPRHSVSTLGEFHSSIPSERLIRFAFPFSQKSASSKSHSSAKRPQQKVEKEKVKPLHRTVK